MPKSTVNGTGFLDLLFTNVVSTAYGAVGSGLQAAVTPGSFYISLHTAAPGVGGSQTTSEISYTGYARIAVARSTAGWTTSSGSFGPQVTNDNALTFGLMTGGTGGDARFWGVGTASTGTGQLLYYGALALEVAKPIVVADLTEVTLANNNIVCPGHGFTAGDQVTFTTVAGDALPTGISADTWYWVLNASAGADADMFRVEASLGGGAVDITAAGSGYVAKALQKNIALNDEPKIAAGGIVIVER